MHNRLTKAFTAAQTVFDEATEEGRYRDIALSVQRKSFFYDFKLLSVSKKWDEGRYEFRPIPIVLEKVDHHGYVVRLPPFDAHDDIGPIQAAYTEFADEVNTGSPYLVGPLTRRESRTTTDGIEG